MGGYILVVDDLEPNRKVLEARLAADDYTVVCAEGGMEALSLVEASPPDLILLDVMMPEIDGFEVCRRLKANPSRAHIPVVMVTALTEHRDRLTGLNAGADDFLSKPWDDAVLIARVRSLLRLKGVMDQLAVRQETGDALQAMDQDERDRVAVGARILIIDDACRSAERLARRLEDDHRPRLETDIAAAMRFARGPWDLVIVNVEARGYDGLNVIGRLHSEETTQHLPILAVVDAGSRNLTIEALKCGASDVIQRPIDNQELVARVRSLVKHKRYADFLRDRLDESLSSASQDQLTRAATQNFAQAQLRDLMAEAARFDTPLSVALVDVDGFSHINAAHGHRGGDHVLRELAARLRDVCEDHHVLGRQGGDQFLVVLPGMNANDARLVCKALREDVAGEPFCWTRDDGQTCELDVLVSLGLTEYVSGDPLGQLLDRAGKALSAAKERGGNRVVTALRRAVAA